MRRAVFSELQRRGLERRFQIQKYISKPERKKLAEKLALKDSQVKLFFLNASRICINETIDIKLWALLCVCVAAPASDVIWWSLCLFLLLYIRVRTYVVDGIFFFPSSSREHIKQPAQGWAGGLWADAPYIIFGSKGGNVSSPAGAPSSYFLLLLLPFYNNPTNQNDRVNTRKAF